MRTPGLVVVGLVAGAIAAGAPATGLAGGVPQPGGLLAVWEMAYSDDLLPDPGQMEPLPVPRLFVDAGYGYYRSTLEATGNDRYEVAQHTLGAGLAWPVGSQWTIRVGVGAILGGQISRNGRTRLFYPGVLLGLSANWRLVQGDGAVPFVDVSGSLAASWAETERDPGEGRVTWLATDLRLGARVGWFVWDALALYAVARAFAGPVLWTVGIEHVVGADVHYYQAGAGLTAYLGRWGLLVEALPLGEQSFFGGLSYVF